MADQKSSGVATKIFQSYFYVMIWMANSIAVILANKWLLAYSGFPYPLSLTLWHMFICSTVGFLCVRVFKLVKSHNMPTSEYMRRVVPIGILYAASLWLSNSAYLYLSVSFIQMTKSLMPGLVYSCGISLGTEKFSSSSALNMLLIAFGVLVCAVGEANLVMKGLIQQLIALLFEAARLTLVQILMAGKGIKLNPLQSLYYVSPACFLCLLVPFSFVELQELLRDPPVIYPAVFLGNGMIAFSLNLAVFLLIGKTSALTMNIAGVIKDWLLIFFSYSVFHAPVTKLNMIGYIFCCSGVAVYNYQKLQILKQDEKQKSAPKTIPIVRKDEPKRTNTVSFVSSEKIMKGIKGEYSWPEREEADGGKVAGYHAFWRRKSESSEPHDWEPFLDVLPVQYGDDTLKAGIEKAVSDGINAELKTIPALFEYAVVHQCRPNKRVKVYLGKAMNFQASQDEMLKGDTNETKDMWNYFRLALQHNCSIVRRYCYYSAHEMKSGRDRKIDPQTLIDRAESRFLSSFDYPWNRQPGSDERGIYLTPHNALCCIPRGVDVIRIHPSMVTSS